jgi:hypothetical protein
MNAYDKFLTGHRTRLLDYLGRLDATTETEALSFVEHVLDVWHDRFDDSQLLPATQVERSFWYTLYLLEEYMEVRATAPREPMLAYMCQDLKAMRLVLKQGVDLPVGRFATRPDGDWSELDDLSDEEMRLPF